MSLLKRFTKTVYEEKAKKINLKIYISFCEYSFRFVVYNSAWVDQSRFFMFTMRSQTRSHFMQSFDVDPDMQKYVSVRVPTESDHDLDSNTQWKNDSLTPKIFLVYLSGTVLCFSFLQDNEVIFEKTFENFGANIQNISKIYFEIYSPRAPLRRIRNEPN